MRCVRYTSLNLTEFSRKHIFRDEGWYYCMCGFYVCNWAGPTQGVVELSWSNQPSARGMSGDATRKLCRPCLHTLHTCSSELCTIYWPPIHDHGQTHRSGCEMWEALISWLNTIWWLLKVRQRLIFSNEPACGCQWEMGAEGVGALVRLLQGKIFHFVSD